MRSLAILLVVGCGSSEPAPGVLHGGIERTDDRLIVKFQGTGVNVKELGIEDRMMGLPISGTADVMIDFKTPADDFRKALGTIALGCAKCTIGSGTIKPNPKSKFAQQLVGEIAIGQIDLDRLELRFTITNGQAKLVMWHLDSPDLDLDISGHVELAERWSNSTLDACLRFRVKPQLQQRSPKTAALLALAGAHVGEDGFHNIRVRGTPGKPVLRAELCK
jgi:type II secretion system protein N